MEVEILGWIGATAFAISGVPQMIKSIREGHSSGVSHGLIWLWLTGEAAMLLYTTLKYSDVILLTNYIANLIFVGVIAWYKYFPRKTKGPFF